MLDTSFCLVGKCYFIYLYYTNTNTYHHESQVHKEQPFPSTLYPSRPQSKLQLKAGHTVVGGLVVIVVVL